MNEQVNIAGHTLSLGTIAGSLVGYLPSAAAGLAVVWYLVLLYDRFVRGK